MGRDDVFGENPLWIGIVGGDRLADGGPRGSGLVRRGESPRHPHVSLGWWINGCVSAMGCPADRIR